ncbi:hypothetical protein CSKR_201480 [Clonorchis sinensis]|uniref:Uncharacterized protein n=1 Tax=Clonorchis sinensis TaxID=79923 RepID=A0A8T1MRN4_CLOSI|nr:hypothetical protein CSKR_201480 [Clonorchis sinensis]
METTVDAATIAMRMYILNRWPVDPASTKPDRLYKLWPTRPLGAMSSIPTISWLNDDLLGCPQSRASTSKE